MARAARPRQISLHASSSMPPAALMRAIVQDPLPNMFVSWRWVPAVLSTSPLHGSWNQEGAQRVLHLEGGKQMLETAVQVRPGLGFTYRLTGFTNALRFFLTSVDDIWQFDDDGRGGTHVSWRWVLHGRGGRGLLTRIFTSQWSKYMETILTASLDRLSHAQDSARITIV